MQGCNQVTTNKVVIKSEVETINCQYKHNQNIKPDEEQTNKQKTMERQHQAWIRYNQGNSPDIQPKNTS